MVDRLKPLLLVLAAALALPAVAEGLPAGGLPDPTRPPAAIEPALKGTATGEGGAAVVEARPMLTSVIIPVRGRARAIVDGRTLSVGDAFGERTVARISEAGVVLKGPQGTETLALTPGIEKKMRKTAPVRARARVEKP